MLLFGVRLIATPPPHKKNYGTGYITELSILSYIYIFVLIPLLSQHHNVSNHLWPIICHPYILIMQCKRLVPLSEPNSFSIQEKEGILPMCDYCSGITCNPCIDCVTLCIVCNPNSGRTQIACTRSLGVIT